MKIEIYNHDIANFIKSSDVNGILEVEWSCFRNKPRNNPFIWALTRCEEFQSEFDVDQINFCEVRESSIVCIANGSGRWPSQEDRKFQTGPEVWEDYWRLVNNDSPYSIRKEYDIGEMVKHERKKYIFKQHVKSSRK